jgi:hypothetical protein
MPWLAAALNFFFPGAGYLVLKHKVPMAIAWLLGVIGLTFVETSLKPIDPTLYWTMFASVFVMNTAFAVDAYQVGKARAAQPGGAAQPAM